LACNINMLQAGSMGEVCNPDSVTVSCPCAAWDVGISALYLQHNSESDLLNPVLSGESGQSNIINPPWKWGFLLEGSYHFNTGNDININWLHFDPRYSQSAVQFFPNAAIPRTNTTNFTFKTTFDAINFELAQMSHFGKKTNIRFYGGAQYAYAKINREIYNFELNEFQTTNTLFQQTNLSTKFQGIGPRIGLDMSYNVMGGFSVFGQGAIALLAGEGKARLSGSNLSGSSFFPFYSYAERRGLVPELDARLGASYEWNTHRGNFSLTTGWMFQHYFDMFLLPTGENSNPATAITQHNFSLDGPFIKGKWVSEC